MRRPDLTVTVLPTRGGAGPSAPDDVVVTLAPEAWSAARLVRGVGRTRDLVEGLVVVGWCGPRELRLVRGPDPVRARLGPVVDLLARALRPELAPRTSPPSLTMVDVPDGHRLFDEMVTGRKVVVAQLLPHHPEAVQRWLRLLAVTAGRVVRSREDLLPADAGPGERAG